MLEARALSCERRRQIGVVNDSYLGIAKNGGKLVWLHARVAVDRDWWVASAQQSLGYRSEGVIGVYKNSVHLSLPSRPRSHAAKRGQILFSKSPRHVVDRSRHYYGIVLVAGDQRSGS